MDGSKPINQASAPAAGEFRRKLNRLLWHMERPAAIETEGDSRWAVLGLLLLSAVLLALSFPQPGWGLLAHIALAPAALAAVWTRGVVFLLVASLLVAIAWWLHMFHWLVPVTVEGYVLLSLYQALWAPVAVMGLRGLRLGLRVPLVIALPLMVVTMEWCRGAFPEGGLAWFNLAHTQVNLSLGGSPGWLLQTADLFGEWTVSFLVAMTSGLIADLLLVPLIGVDEQQRRRPSRAAGTRLMIWFAFISAGLIYGHMRIAEVQAAARQMRSIHVGVVQTNVPQTNKLHPTLEQQLEDWHRLVALMRKLDERNRTELSHDPLDLMVWPETASPVSLNAESVHVLQAWEFPNIIFSDLASLRRDVDTPMLVGSSSEEDWTLTDDDFPMAQRRFNSALLFLPPAEGDDPMDLTPAGRYDKIHLVPFGEYMPWVSESEWLRNLFLTYISPYDFDYSINRGDAVEIFEIPLRTEDRTVRVVTPICFEDVVSRFTRRMVFQSGVRRADFMINLTNDGWFGGPGQRPQHAQVSALRAVELRTPMIRSVNTGVSVVWDATGRLVAEVGEDGRRQHVAGIMNVRVNATGLVPLYAHVGTLPVVMVSLLTLVAAGVGCWIARRNRIEQEQ
ncbi:MAG: apolipoprotein N-acyltransferase [Phycisphaeraceae bacterium]|nr:apolipoprotein N-acyltransferase [Phycisphaeraceae bacterium]